MPRCIQLLCNLDLAGLVLKDTASVSYKVKYRMKDLASSAKTSHVLPILAHLFLHHIMSMALQATSMKAMDILLYNNRITTSGHASSALSTTSNSIDTHIPPYIGIPFTTHIFIKLALPVSSSLCGQDE